MKNRFYTITILFLLFIVAVLLRLWGLNSDGVLWHDEYYSYFVAYPDNLLQIKKLSLTANSQPPLYHWILNIWMRLFGNSDWVLKLLSTLFNCSAVIISYFCGKHLELLQKIDKNPSKTGIIFAFLLAINSVSIYYSQEVRPYPLIILLSTLLLFAILRILHQFNNKNLSLLILVNFLLLYTHTLALYFCFFEILILFVYFYKTNRDYLKKIILSSVILAALCIPLIYDILTVIVHRSFGWNKFCPLAVFSLFNDYFSPWLININFHILTFEKIFSNTTLIFMLVVFSIPLIIIYFMGIIKAVMNNSISKYLFMISFLYLISMLILSINGKMTFLPRYGLIVLPFLLLICSYGFLLFNGHFINTKSIIGTILILNFIFMFSFQEINAQNLEKKIFHTNFNDLSKTLNEYKFNSGDVFIIMYYAATNRYVDAPKYYDFSNYETYIVDGCIWSYPKTPCRLEKMVDFENTIKDIKKTVSPNKSIIIVIPDDESRFYEKTIENTHLETRYKKVEKIRKNNWSVLIYSNKS